MAKLYDRAGMSTTTTGTGTLTLGSALGNVSPNLAGFLTFAGAGVPNATDVSYLILDSNNNWEVGHGTYTTSGTTLTRNVTASSNGGSAINLSGNAQVFITIRAEDLITLDASGNATFAGVFDITNTTDATSTTTGALQSAGGLAVAKRSHFGDTLAVDAAWNAFTNGTLDGTASTVTIGPSGNVTIPNSLVGLFVICEVAQTGGSTAVLLTGGTAATIVGQTNAGFYTIGSSPGNGHIGINNNGSNVTTIYNGYTAVSIQVRIIFLRLA